ncbi:hypothetical protein ASG96_12540 [Terrabacter sp. Soil810]|nr:hypothetical protein ASD90_13685 [Terrabacter sp. Root181]KRF41520.1 hypothetical protein ASG96_12540 [Terrabacter sp. Soil810]
MMRDETGRPDPSEPGRAAWSRRFGRSATEQPLPWVVAGLVFIVNAVLSATRGDWWLAALEGCTGLLAGLSAYSVSTRRSPERERPVDRSA